MQDAEIGQTGGLSLKWSGSDIVLKWHETEGAEGYEVFRSCQSKAEVDFKLLADVESQDFSGYTDFGRNKDYVDIYRVRAYTKDQESGERIYGDYSDKVYSVKIAKRLPVMTYHHLCKAKSSRKSKSTEVYMLKTVTLGHK